MTRCHPRLIEGETTWHRQKIPIVAGDAATLAAKSKNELLNLIRDLYALNPENKDFVRAQARTPKAPARRKVMVKDIRSGKTFAVVSSGKTPAVAPRSQMSSGYPKIRHLATSRAELRQGNHFNVTRLTTLKSLCEDATAAARFAVISPS